MENEIGTEFLNGRVDGGEIADVAFDFFDEGFADGVVKVRSRGRGQAQAEDFGLELVEPKREPGAFETGVAGHQDAFAPVKLFEHPVLLAVGRKSRNPGERRNKGGRV